MFGRKQPQTLKDKVLSRGGDIAGAATSTARRFSQAQPGKIDRYAAGALLLGMGNWLSMSLFNFDAIKAIAGRKSVSGRTAYGLLSASAVYGAIRGAQKAGR